MNEGFRILETDTLSDQTNSFQYLEDMVIIPESDFYIGGDQNGYPNSGAYPFIGWLLTQNPLTRIVSREKPSTIEIGYHDRGYRFIQALSRKKIEAAGLSMAPSQTDTLKEGLWKDIEHLFPERKWDALYHHMLGPQMTNEGKFEATLNVLNPSGIYIGVSRTTSPSPDPVYERMWKTGHSIGTMLIDDLSVKPEGKSYGYVKYYNIYCAKKV